MRRVSGKKLVGVVAIVAIVLTAAGVFFMQRAPVQETAPELGDVDKLLEDLDEYLTFENQDILSGLEELGWG